MIRDVIRKLLDRMELQRFLKDKKKFIEDNRITDTGDISELNSVYDDIMTIVEASTIENSPNIDMERSFERKTRINRRKFLVTSSSTVLGAAMGIFLMNIGGKKCRAGTDYDEGGRADGQCNYLNHICDLKCNNNIDCYDTSGCRDHSCQNLSVCVDESDCGDSECDNEICSDNQECADFSVCRNGAWEDGSCVDGGFLHRGCTDSKCVNFNNCRNSTGSEHVHCVDQKCDDVDNCFNGHNCEDIDDCVDSYVCNDLSTPCGVPPADNPQCAIDKPEHCSNNSCDVEKDID